MIKILNDHKAFTLIEVMIAVSILTVGLLAVGAMQISAIRGNDFSNNTSAALILAEEKMETLLHTDYNDSELNDGAHGPETVDEAGQAGGSFNRTWTVDTYSNPDYKEITMTVEWGDDHQITLVSIKRR